MAGILIGRIPSDAHMAFCRDVRIPRVYSRTPDHGRAARVVKFLLHSFGVETRARISGVGWAPSSIAPDIRASQTYFSEPAMRCDGDVNLQVSKAGAR